MNETDYYNISNALVKLRQAQDMIEIAINVIEDIHKRSNKKDE